MTSTDLMLSADGDEAAEVIGWCEHGTLDGNTCEHCADGAEDFGLPPLPWRLMVVALAGNVAPPEPVQQGPDRRHLAPKAGD